MKQDKFCFNKNALILVLIAFALTVAAFSLSALSGKKNITSTKANETKTGSSYSIKLDSSFGNGGTKVFDDPAINDAVSLDSENKAVYQKDGKILVMVGDRFSGNIIRLLPDGQVDTGFGNGGVVDTGLWRLNSILLLPDGKFIVSGDAEHTKVDNSILRFNSDGTKDISFEKIDLSKFAQQDAVVAANLNLYALAMQPTGSSYKIIAAGRIRLENPNNGAGQFHCYIARFTKDGAIDKSFGYNGETLTEFVSGTSSGATSVLVQPDRKILVGGYDISGAQTFGLLRLTENGAFMGTSSDDSGETFRKKIEMLPNAISIPNNIIIQKSGKIVMGGTINRTEAGEFNYGLVRFNTDGTIDPTFGGNNDGKVLYPINYENALHVFPIMKSIKALSNDQILLAGSYALKNPTPPPGAPANPQDFALTLLSVDGIPSDIGSNGTVFTNVSTENASRDRADSMDVSSTGKVVVVGVSANYTTGSSHPLEAAQYLIGNMVYLPQINR